MTSPRTRVESTSSTISRLLRRRQPGLLDGDVGAGGRGDLGPARVRSAVDSAPETVSSKLVTG